MNQPSKDIIVLSDFEHVLQKPTIYVGAVQPTEEKIPLYRNGVIVEEIKLLSVGFYKILNEAIDNAFDEAKRQGGNISIEVEFNSKENSAAIIDTGGGFKNAEKIHPKSKLTNVETALTMLRAGSNFSNDTIEQNIVGTNGMGISLSNMLSDEFEITSINENVIYHQKWKQFKSIVQDINPRKKETRGTMIKFIPRKDTFKNSKWDKEYIYTQMLFRKWILSFDPILQGVDFKVTWDGKELDLDREFVPQNSLFISHKLGTVCIYPNFQGSIRTSFINGTQATSVGQRQVHEVIIHDQLNKALNYEYGNNFYETIITLNIPPALMRFGDQNKTRFVTVRPELEPLLDSFLKKIYREFSKSELCEQISDSIQESLRKTEIKKIRASKKDNSIQFSDKYFPPGKHKKRIFLCEGLSAAGSLAQKRNKDGDAVYGLRGKVKNVQTLSDLSSNKEILELINILNLDLEKETCDFDQIVIATDPDCLENDTLIETNNGPIKISDLNIGDYVLTDDGSYQKIIDKISSIKTDYIKIKIFGKNILCSKNHKWIVLRDNKIQEVLAKNLLKSDLFLIQK